jgi:hypothetical protein
MRLHHARSESSSSNTQKTKASFREFGCVPKTCQRSRCPKNFPLTLLQRCCFIEKSVWSFNCIFSEVQDCGFESHKKGVQVRAFPTGNCYCAWRFARCCLTALRACEQTRIVVFMHYTCRYQHSCCALVP